MTSSDTEPLMMNSYRMEPPLTTQRRARPVAAPTDLGTRTVASPHASRVSAQPGCRAGPSGRAVAPSGAESEETEAASDADRLAPGAGAELRVDRAHVRLDGVQADALGG